MAKAKAVASGDDVQDAMNKQFGEGSVMTLGDASHMVVGEGVSTGSLKLDLALGGFGLPYCRLVEVIGAESSGKTTLALKAMADAQKKGMTCVIIDAEHALDPTWAKNLGVDLGNVKISQPSYGEEGLIIAENYLKSGRQCFVFIDSVAALVPKKELEGEQGDSHVGLQARMMSQACRRLTGIISEHRSIVVFSNQIREKIGVTWGCFNYATRVTLSDGTQEKIGKIVNQKLPVEVMSFDPATGKISPKKVVGWHDNGPTDSFLRFFCESAGEGKNRSTFACTDNHLIFTPGMVGVPAKSLKQGDMVLTSGRVRFNEDQMACALSQVLGDGSLRQSGQRVSLRVKHGWAQEEYAKWKSSIFGERLIGSTENKAGDYWGFDLSPTCDLRGVEDCPSLISRMGVKGVALWIMDDGSFGGSFARWGNGKTELSVKRWTNEQRERAADEIEKLGLPRPTVRKRSLLWSGDKNGTLQQSIAPYIPVCMKYKIKPSLHHMLGSYKWDSSPCDSFVLVPSVIRSVSRIPPNGGSTHKFDITVEGNHTYFVDGCAVHNSNETTPGGRALKFYSTCRIDLRRIGTLKNGETPIGIRVKSKVLKNKVAPPFREAEFSIFTDGGISFENDVLDLAIDRQLVKKSGSWFYHNEKSMGQGECNAIGWLKENPDIRDELVQKIKASGACVSGGSDSAEDE